jgi:hypothetical protein
MMLNDSPVRYDAIAHTYTAPDGRQLRGITGLLKERLGLGSYDGVSEEVLQRAAERGTEVHRLCEEWDNIGQYPEGNADAEAYIALQADNDLRHVCSEYLVSDGHTYASPIDKVFKRGHVYDLADIKTTYRLDKEYVSWQLSVYAFLFELQNPLLSVGNLYAIHLRNGKAKMVAVERKPIDQVKKLLYTTEPMNVDPYAMPSKWREREDELIKYTHLMEVYKRKVEDIKAEMLEEMTEQGVSRWETPFVQIVRREGSRTERFDAKRFKEEHADMYAEYVTESVTKASITIKIKGE